MAATNYEQWREVLRKFVQENEKTDEIGMALNELLKQLNSDNVFNLGIPYKLNVVVEDILKLSIGEEKFEWLMWWMYDSISCMSGKRHAVVSMAVNDSESSDCELLNFDEFFDFAFMEVSVEQIKQKRIVQ